MHQPLARNCHQRSGDVSSHCMDCSALTHINITMAPFIIDTRAVQSAISLKISKPHKHWSNFLQAQDKLETCFFSILK